MTKFFERLRLLGRGWKQSLSSYLQLYPDDDALAPAFRAKQLRAVLRMTPLTMLANLLNAALIGVNFWDLSNHWLLSAWMAMVAFAAIQGIRARWRKPSRPTASRKALRRATVHAALLALLWGLLTASLFPDASGPQQLLLAVMLSGMMSAGGLALATLPLAGTAWVLILTLSSFAAILQGEFPMRGPVSLLLLIYSVTMIASVWSTARSFASRLMAEATSEQQNQVIGLLLRDFEENASDVLWEIDASGHLNHISKRVEEALGLSAAKLSKAPLISLLAENLKDDPPASRQYLVELISRLEQGISFRDLLMPVTTSGQKRWWSLTAKPLYDARGQALGWRGVASNVTERMQAQEAMRTQHERLEVLVQERTAKLNQALTAAEAASRAKSLFLSSMSHELRTPLNAVLGYAQLLGMSGDASQETRESVAEIESAGKHLLALVNDILDLARIESGKLEMNIEDVELSGALAEARRVLAPLAQRRGITLDLPEQPVVLRADTVRLRQVLFNLITNAIKYNRDGGRVSVTGELVAQHQYRITVRDTGFGIPPERLGELFQPFNRIGAERGSVEGTGIGLVITKTLVESMDGLIGVESVVGEGCAFWVELPLVASAPRSR
jgi:PAS domain S-box-containing protein